MKLKKFINNNFKKDIPTFFSILLPFLYILGLLITKDLDYLQFIIPFPFEIIIFIIEWVTYLFGGWPLAVTTEIVFWFFVGKLFGKLCGYLSRKLGRS